jgi:tetratricopeptide (TPR) repeat protein
VARDLGTTLPSTVEASCAEAVAALPRNYGALGRYVLLEVVGQGGMGVVWQAYDPVLDRKIALKLIVPTAGARGQIVSEAQAMARIQHPNVVTVYDAGVQHAGDHELAYVAMELVAGKTLKQWLDGQERPLDEQVAMFMLAGRGLEAAHAAGLVHRDFKPSNVLLGDDGRVRVSDFGLALLSGDDAGVVTADGAAKTSTLLSPIAGTPRYMSPEQLNGLPADARSDQFAFCVALYEALFGAHPFAAADDTALADRRAKVLQPPVAAQKSRLAARLAPAILRGLAADPARRWGSMGELLDVLDVARRQRWRRLALGAGFTALVAVAAVVGLREAAALPRACRHAGDAVTAAWSPEQHQALGAAFARLGSRGGEVWQRVAPTLDDWAARWRTLRVEACEADRNGAHATAPLTARRECLDRRLGELGGLVQALDKPDDTVASYAVRAAHGLTPPESCLSALPPADAAVARQPARAAVAAVQAQIDHATALRRLGKQAPALAAAKGAAADAARLDWTPLTAEAQIELGRTSLDVNATNPATDAFYQALWTAEAARDDLLRFEATMGLFKVSLDASEYALAARWHETTKAIARHLPADATRQVRLGFDDMRLALYLERPKQCVQSGEETLRLAERAAPGTPLNISIMINLSRCYASLNQGEKTLALLKRALPMSEKINGHEEQQTASVLTELGQHERRARNYAAALADYHEALAIRERMVGPDNPDCAGMHNNIGNVLRELKRYDEARGEYEHAIAVWTQAWGPDSPAIAVGTTGLGRIAMAEGQPAKAEELYRRVLEIRKKKRPPGHPDIIDAEELLGEALLMQKKAEALPLLEEVLAAVEKDKEAPPGDRADARFTAARARVELGVRRAGALDVATAACKELDAPASHEAFAACSAWLTQHGAHSGAKVVSVP